MKRKLVAVGCLCLAAVCAFSLPPVKPSVGSMKVKIGRKALETAAQKYVGDKSFAALSDEMLRDIRNFPELPQQSDRATDVEDFFAALHLAESGPNASLAEMLAKFSTVGFNFPETGYPFLEKFFLEKAIGTELEPLWLAPLARTALSDPSQKSLQHFKQLVEKHGMTSPFLNDVVTLAAQRGVYIRLPKKSSFVQDARHDGNGLLDHFLYGGKFDSYLRGKGVFPYWAKDLSREATETWMNMSFKAQRNAGVQPEVQDLKTFSYNPTLLMVTRADVEHFSVSRELFINTFVKEQYRAEKGPELYDWYIGFQKNAQKFLTETEAASKTVLNKEQVQEILKTATGMGLTLGGFINSYLDEAPSSLDHFYSVLKDLKQRAQLSAIGMR